MKSFLIAFDDTDNLETLGTGHVLDGFLNSLPYAFSYITRHQLFVSDDVPYTSHNSAMCAQVACDMACEELALLAGEWLATHSASGSDPGLCVADIDALAAPSPLIDWGRRAKVEVLYKQDAYELAKRCDVHLSEHGGDGQGVVGALAAVGLRLSGDDGRVRGRVAVQSARMTVGELLAATGFDRVCTTELEELSCDSVVEMSEAQVKAVYRDASSTVLVEPVDGTWRLLDRRQLKRY